MLKNGWKKRSDSLEQFDAIGLEISQSIAPGDIICLNGPLGAGKTTLVKSLVKAFGGNPDLVNSPTFTYLHAYPTLPPVYHFDLYRLADTSIFLRRGFDEYLDHPDGICLIEWAERIESILPSRAKLIEITPLNAESRNIEWQW